MTNNFPRMTLRQYFAGLTESTFQTQLGVADPSLIDYLSELLVRFVRLDAVYKVRNLSGRPVDEVAGMLCEANQRIGNARRAVHRHIGDFTLFWTGVFPEAVREMQKPQSRDCFIDYCAHGKRSYLIAAGIEADEDDDPPGDLLERLGRQFEMCAYGLREVRREWERRDDADFSRPMLID